MKKINIKNYSTEISSATSISNIEKLLIQIGVRDIKKRYNDLGLTSHIAFALPIDNRHLTFDLEAKVEPIYALFLNEYTRPTERSREICWEQSERTAWKLIHDWVQINISMILLDQGEPLELFFPKLNNGKETFYAKIKANDYKLLLS